MSIEWYQSLEIGNENVDLQHKFFANLINRIEKNMHDSLDPSRSCDLLMELKKYAEFHFCSEENIARHMNLPGLASHHLRHIELLDEFTAYEKEIKLGIKSLSDFMKFLNHWFLSHTYYEDQILFNGEMRTTENAS